MWISTRIITVTKNIYCTIILVVSINISRYYNCNHFVWYISCLIQMRPAIEFTRRVQSREVERRLQLISEYYNRLTIRSSRTFLTSAPPPVCVTSLYRNNNISWEDWPNPYNKLHFEPIVQNRYHLNSYLKDMHKKNILDHYRNRERIKICYQNSYKRKNENTSSVEPSG